MQRLLEYLLCGLLVFSFSAIFPKASHAQEVHESDEMLVQLVSETTNPKPGSKVRLALRFVAKPGWHSYWSFPGDTGIATQPDWKLPKGVKIEPFRHPAPQRLPMGPMASFVHEGEHWLVTSMSVPRSFKPGDPLPVRLSLFWGACSDNVCMPMTGNFELPLVVGDGIISSDMKALFDKAEGRIPKALAKASMVVDDKSVRVFMDLPKNTPADALVFFPRNDDLIEASALGVINKLKDGRYELVITRKPGSKSDTKLSGVIVSPSSAWAFGPLKAVAAPTVPVSVISSAPTLGKIPDANKSGIFGMPVVGAALPAVSPDAPIGDAQKSLKGSGYLSRIPGLSSPSEQSREAFAKAKAEDTAKSIRLTYGMTGLLGLMVILFGAFLYRKARY